MNLIQKNNLKVAIILLIVMALLTWIGIRNSPDSIHHPDNEEFVVEVAFNLGIEPNEVTQLQFAKRYLQWEN